MQQVVRAMDDGDLPSFVDGLRREAWMLSDACVKFQVGLIEGTAAALNDRAAFLKALLDLDPAVLHCPRAAAVQGLCTSRSRMRRPICFRCCCGSGPCPTICHTQPGTGTSHG